MRKKILFVDDHCEILSIANITLKSLGHESLLVSSGDEAIKIINNNSDLKIDLIFLDLMMPETNGFDVLRFMNDLNIQIPVVLQTAVMDESDLKKATDLGVKGFLFKPYTKEDIECLINRHS